jgi:thiosulfate reductase cytochrome b subunit
MTSESLFYRHTATVRVCHWINVLSLTLLLMSGLQIFNFHPALYWGHNGHAGMPPVLSISADAERSTLQIGSIELGVSGVLGVNVESGNRTRFHAFPPLVTLPAERDLALGRDWHFLIAWLFAFNGIAYLSYGLASGHFRGKFVPDRQQLTARHLWHELREHVRFKRARGEAARSYNVLQKLTYAVVVFILLPVMVLTGLTMSNAVTAWCPLLIDLFGGRQSARTIHFFTAMALVLFVLVHVMQVFVAGFANEMRSMITGRFKVPPEIDA